MIFDEKFDVTVQQIGQFQFIIKVKVEEKTFSAPIQCQFLNEEMGFQIWSDINNRKQFFLDLETVKSDK